MQSVLSRIWTSVVVSISYGIIELMRSINTLNRNFYEIHKKSMYKISND